MAAAAAGLVLPNANHPSAPLGPSAPKTVSSKSARTSNRTVITGQIVFVPEPICAGFSSAKAAANWVRHERANEAREYRGESPLALPCLFVQVWPRFAMPHDPAIRSVRMHQVLPGLYSFRAGVGPEPCSAQRDAKPKWLPSVDEHGIHLLATAAVRPNQASCRIVSAEHVPQ